MILKIKCVAPFSFLGPQRTWARAFQPLLYFPRRHRCQTQIFLFVGWKQNLHANFFALLFSSLPSFFWLVWQKHPLWHTFLQCSSPRFCTLYLIDSQQVPSLEIFCVRAISTKKKEITMNFWHFWFLHREIHLLPFGQFFMDFWIPAQSVLLLHDWNIKKNLEVFITGNKVPQKYKRGITRELEGDHEQPPLLFYVMQEEALL